MREVVLRIASLSLSGGILALALLMLRPLTGRLSRSLQHYLWLIVLLRLALPVTLETNLMGAAFGAIEDRVTQGRTLRDGEASTREAPRAANDLGGFTEAQISESMIPADPKPIGPGSHPGNVFAFPPGFIWAVVFTVWLTGALATLGWGIAGYLRFIHALKAANRPASRSENELLQDLCGSLRASALRNPRVRTPMLVGLIRPRILLPDIDYEPESLRMIFLHELTHLRRGDIALRWLSQIVFALHWFNPLLIPARREMNRACELACDEAVVAGLDSAARRRYGEMLLRIVTEDRTPVLTRALAAEKRALQERLSSIMAVQRRSWRTTAASAALLAIMIAGALVLGACAPGTLSTSDTVLIPDKSSATGTSVPPTVKVQSVESVKNSIVNRGHTSFPFSIEEMTSFRSLAITDVADADAVSKIVSKLPLPDHRLNLRYIAVGMDQGTGSAPYTLSVFYDRVPVNADADHLREQLNAPNSLYSKSCRKNALILFGLIDNLQEVTFHVGFVDSAQFKEDAYADHYIIPRASLSEFGDAKALWTEDGSKLIDAFVSIDNNVQKVGGKEIPLEVVRMMSAKGDRLRLIDFRDYVEKGVDADGNPINIVEVDGDMRYCLSFAVEGNFMLDVEGEMGEKPVTSATLRRSTERYGDGIDIRSEAISALLSLAAPSSTPSPVDAAVSAEGFSWPATGKLSVQYGMRWNRLHAGIDIATEEGTPVYAARAGTVTRSAYHSGYGQFVDIDHGDGILTRYAHNSRLLCKEGDRVERGDLIALSGSTGNATGPHVHFEVRDRNDPVNPDDWLPPFGERTPEP